MGYTGGKTRRPTYETVCSGDGHTEAVMLEYDPAILSYAELVREFFEDPRVRDVYEPDDEAAQYRTAVWAQDAAQDAHAASSKDAPE